ncbi:hypothetical protein H2248_000704 [Termitomyces sp. 'cryptogamus']|nr:hypothetical protein H2248_000704 [Termitomyces sp. 'cryptogamus']
MHTDDSLTESGSISSASHESDPSQRCGYLVTFRSGDLRDEDLCPKTLHAIDQIKLCNIVAIERDATVHETILSAANTLLHFLDRVCLLRSREWCITVALYLFPHLSQSMKNWEKTSLKSVPSSERQFSVYPLPSSKRLSSCCRSS